MSPGQIFCRVSFNWNFSESFLMIRLGWWAFERKTTEENCHFRHIAQGYMPSTRLSPVGVTLITWLRVFVAFSPVVTFFFPFPYCAFKKKVPKHSPHQRAGINPLKGRVSTYIIWTSSVLKTCVFSPTYLFIQPFISIRMDPGIFTLYFRL